MPTGTPEPAPHLASPLWDQRVVSGHNAWLRFLQELDRVLFPSQDIRYRAELKANPPYRLPITPPSEPWGPDGFYQGCLLVG